MIQRCLISLTAAIGLTSSSTKKHPLTRPVVAVGAVGAALALTTWLMHKRIADVERWRRTSSNFSALAKAARILDAPVAPEGEMPEGQRVAPLTSRVEEMAEKVKQTVAKYREIVARLKNLDVVIDVPDRIQAIETRVREISGKDLNDAETAEASAEMSTLVEEASSLLLKMQKERRPRWY